MFHESWPQSIFLSLALVNETYSVEFLAQYVSKIKATPAVSLLVVVVMNFLAVNLFHSILFINVFYFD